MGWVKRRIERGGGEFSLVGLREENGNDRRDVRSGEEQTTEAESPVLRM